MNVFTEKVMNGAGDVIVEAIRRRLRPSKGAVITSGKDSFSGGADLTHAAEDASASSPREIAEETAGRPAHQGWLFERGAGCHEPEHCGASWKPPASEICLGIK